MKSFKVEQVTPNSLRYEMVIVGKGSMRVAAGLVRTKKAKDFDMDALTDFAEASADHELNPPKVEQSNYKGMHGGSIVSIALRAQRKHRKTHAERRAQIASRK